jgi:uncharacterized repeat protein (TIGR03803 family)
VSKLSTWKVVSLLCVFCSLAVMGWPAETFTTLASFNLANGAFPFGSLVQGFNGNFYGTTEGTVFEITAAGKLTTLDSFDGTDVGSPDAGLMQATNGNFYGTTFNGGVNNSGVVFEMTPAGKVTTLYSFCSQPGCTDGESPEAGLVQATNGNFYGTTIAGGASSACRNYLCGTVFVITPGGKLTTLHSFCSQPDCADGQAPVGELVQAANGNFYGTTEYGGAGGSSCTSDIGCGTVFEITPAGKLTTLYSFCSLPDCTDGESPNAGLIQAANGNFYGTTDAGGAGEFGAGFGTVFEITPGGKLTRLYNFCSQPGCTDGRSPGGLVQATDGNFYGPTSEGGDSDACGESGCGSVFEITAEGKLTTLHSFDITDGYYSDMSYPGAPAPIQGTDGNFYGATSAGGTSSACIDNNNGRIGCGTVFRLTLGLRPFVKPLPTSGQVGATVIVQGNNLTGVTMVTFNGTRATFRVVSSTEITATVPSGATTGPVKVTGPKGTLTSNVNFRVI